VISVFCSFEEKILLTCRRYVFSCAKSPFIEYLLGYNIKWICIGLGFCGAGIKTKRNIIWYLGQLSASQRTRED
jgi:hypothetical protein